MDFTSYNFLLAPPKSENLVHLGWRFIIHVPKRARLTKRAADLPLELHSDTTANPGRDRFWVKDLRPRLDSVNASHGQRYRRIDFFTRPALGHSHAAGRVDSHRVHYVSQSFFRLIGDEVSVLD